MNMKLTKEKLLEKHKDQFWHELSQDVIDEIVASEDMRVGDVLETFKQPTWCMYKDALGFACGCWSLCDNRVGGSRAKISIDFCSSCHCFNIN